MKVDIGIVLMIVPMVAGTMGVIVYRTHGHRSPELAAGFLIGLTVAAIFVLGSEIVDKR